MTALSKLLSDLAAAQQAYEAARTVCCARACVTLAEIEVINAAYDKQHGFKPSPGAWKDGSTTISAGEWSEIKARVEAKTADMYTLRTVERVRDYADKRLRDTTAALQADVFQMEDMHRYA